MDIPGLKAFIAVTEAQSFSIAAEKMHLTQPAVSKRIAALEVELNCQLFDRIGKKVMLTEAGNLLFPRAKSILSEISNTQRQLSNLTGEIAGTLSIGTSHHIGLHRLPSILREYSTLYPNVQMDLRFMDSEEACEHVLQGKLELGIVTLPPDNNKNLNIEQIWSDPLDVLVSNEHPLLNQKIVSLETLSHYPAILPSETTFTRRLVEHHFQNQQLDINVSISTNYLETIKMMVSIGLGWSVLPASMIDSQVKSIAVEGFCVSRKLGVVQHIKHSSSNAAHAMYKLLKKQ